MPVRLGAVHTGTHPMHVHRALAKYPRWLSQIAHRLSTLRQADRLYVMKSGRVVQEGSFAALATTEGVFQDLVRRQMA